MVGTVITASFLAACLGSYQLLRNEHVAVARRSLSLAVVVGFIASVIAALPTGDLVAKQVYKYQPVKFAAMEGHFHTEDGAAMVLIGQPDVENMSLDNPVKIPGLLSFLTHQRWNARLEGLAEFPPDQRPDLVAPLYYSYHIMAGLGTIFIAIMSLGLLTLWRGKLYQQRWMLWILMLVVPFHSSLNTAGWMTSELGRQSRGSSTTSCGRSDRGYSRHVSTGNVWRSRTPRFMGLYLFLAFVYFFVMTRIIAAGRERESSDALDKSDERVLKGRGA